MHRIANKTVLMYYTKASSVISISVLEAVLGLEKHLQDCLQALGANL